MKTRAIGLIAALLLPVLASADQMYTGTWEISGQAAGTVTMRVRDDGRVSAEVVGNTGDRVRGHFEGTFEGKRFKIKLHLRNKMRQEFQGNFTHNDSEAHMDGLQYVDNKPIDDVKFTLNVTTMTTVRQ